jgi:hypothetical protein
VVEFRAGGEYQATLVLEVASGEEAVAAIAAEVREIHAGAAGTVHADPPRRRGALAGPSELRARAPRESAGWVDRGAAAGGVLSGRKVIGIC